MMFEKHVLPQPAASRSASSAGSALGCPLQPAESSIKTIARIPGVAFRSSISLLSSTLEGARHVSWRPACAALAAGAPGVGSPRGLPATRGLRSASELLSAHHFRAAVPTRTLSGS
jgi:hypothetical protein